MPPPDPNKKMEDLLRAYARQRREEAGAPFEMSPDVRARLQEEVRRTLGKPTAAPAPRWGLSLTGWLRLALGGAVAALVMFCLLGVPGKAKSKQFAKADKKTAPASLAAAAQAPAPGQPAAAPAMLPPVAAKEAPLAEAARTPLGAAALSAPATNDLLAMDRSRSLDEAGAKATFEKSKEPPNLATTGGLPANGRHCRRRNCRRRSQRRCRWRLRRRRRWRPWWRCALGSRKTAFATCFHSTGRNRKTGRGRPSRIFGRNPPCASLCHLRATHVSIRTAAGPKCPRG